MCGSYQCNEDSLQNTVALWSKVANKTYVASPAFSWVDDYDAFMRNGRCCSYQEDDHEKICYSEDVLVNPPRDKSPAQYEGYDDYVNEIAPRETTEPPSKVKIKVDIVYFSLGSQFLN